MTDISKLKSLDRKVTKLSAPQSPQPQNKLKPPSLLKVVLLLRGLAHHSFLGHWFGSSHFDFGFRVIWLLSPI
jgi:hypothetical protein